MNHNKRLILTKLETTYGIDSTPAGTDAMLISDLEFSPLESTIEERDNITPKYGSRGGVIAGKHTMVSFKIELAGSGTAGTAPAYDTLLKACGLSATTTAGALVRYTPNSDSTHSATLYFNVDGTLHKMLGARGTFTMQLEASKIAYLSFSFTGLFSVAEEQVAPTPDFSDFITPVIVGESNTTSFTVLGTAASSISFNFDLGNSVVNHQTITEQEIKITDRKATGSLSINAPELSSKNYWQDAIDSTQGTVSWSHGTIDGNIVSFSAPKAQLMNPKYGELNNVVTLESDLQFVGTNDDDFVLEFK